MSDTPFSQPAPGVFNWEMVRLALRAGEEGVFCWVLNTDKIFYTEQCLRMMGLPFHGIAPNIFTEAEKTIHPDDRNFFESTVKRYIDRSATASMASTPLRIELRILNMRAKGWKWVRINGLVDRDANNKPIRLIGLWVDITRRKMTDMHAMSSRDLFRKLINHLPDNIYFKNRESRFIMANDATAKKMGVATPSDLIGRTDRHFFDQSMSDIARREELEVMKTGRPITSRLHKETWRNESGHGVTWSQISKFPLIGADGQTNGIVGISSDVTKLVEAQQEAQRLAIAVEQRRKALEDELRLARDIQQALLPTSIASRHYRCADGSVRTANFKHRFLASHGVAGDCFEIFPVGETGVGIIICDVMGHDISAALIASMLRGIMGQVSSLADTPALLLSSLNQKLCKLFKQSKINMFSTACYVYLDLQNGRLTLSGAGHPAPILIDENGKAFQPAIPRSPALGLRSKLHFRESEFKLRSGMKIMLFTDGLTEAARENGDELGSLRVMEHLNGKKIGDIDDMLDSSIDAMNIFINGLNPSDDICLLGLEFVEQEPDWHQYNPS